MSDEQDTRPAVLQDQHFVIEESVGYRLLRTGAIWLNKLFFGAVVLFVLWVLLGLTGQVEPGCADSVDVGAGDAPAERCSVFLSSTALYLGAMAVLSFVLSIVLGMLGLVVGKRIVEMTPASEEPGAPADAGDAHAAPHERDGPTETDDENR